MTEFTEEQQQVVNDLVGKARIEGRTGKEKVETELAELRAAHEQLTKEMGELKPQVEEVTTLRRDKIAQEVALELEIPVNLASRLTGATREEMLEDGKKLQADLEATTEPKKRMPMVPGTVGEPDENHFEKLGLEFTKNQFSNQKD